MKVAVIGGVPQSLTTFRGELIKAIRDIGHDVYGLAGGEEKRFTDALTSNGIEFVSYPIKRTKLNPFSDLQTLWFLYRWFRKNNIDLVFSYTAKPIIWGGIATRLAGVPHFHAMITGLGRQFDCSTFRNRQVSAIIATLYRYSLKSADSVIFQNADDQRFFIEKKITLASRTHRVNGSGVDLDQYPKSEIKQNPIIFLTAGRLLAEKGFREYVAAAAIVTQNYPNAKFRIVGMRESGANAISQQEIEQWSTQKNLEFIGQVNDTVQVLSECTVFVLATYLREGVPRTILEALAIGRPVITTDNVGCRDAVSHDDNGLLVPVRNAEALAQAMIYMIENPKELSRMAKRARAVAENRYDVKKVNAHMLEIMKFTN